MKAKEKLNVPSGIADNLIPVNLISVEDAFQRISSKILCSFLYTYKLISLWLQTNNPVITNKRNGKTSLKRMKREI